jgi:hypothetical protein
MGSPWSELMGIGNALGRRSECAWLVALLDYVRGYGKQQAESDMNQLPVELSQLRQLLVDHYSEGELHTLCFDLGVDYESLPPGGKADKARDLLAHMERHGRIPALLEIGNHLRPDVDWAQVYLDDRMDDYRARRDQADQARRQLRARQRVVNLRPLDMAHTFKDRVRETQELCTHLAQENVRLISIVG